MNGEDGGFDNHEDNILRAFEQGAQDVMNQKRDPNDFIDFDNPAPQKQNKQQKNNASKYGESQPAQPANTTSKKDIVVIGFDDEEDDDQFTGNTHQVQQSQGNNHFYSQNQQVVNNNMIGGQNDDDDDFDDHHRKDNFTVDRNNQIDNQMFININELDNGNQSNKGQVISRPAGIYLQKDDDLEKLKDLYEGQEKQKVEATNKQFAMNRQAQEKKKKQFQDQKKQKEDKENHNSDVAKLTNNDFKFDKSNKIKNIINDEEELGEIGEWIEKTANVNRKKQDDGFDDDEDEGQKSNNDDEDFNYDDDIPPKQNKNGTQTKQNNQHVIAEDDEGDESWDNKDQKKGKGVNDVISQEVQQQKKKEEQELMRQKQDLINKKLQQQQILKHKSGPIANRLQDKAKFMELTNTNKDQEKTSEKNIQEIQEENKQEDDANNGEDDGVDWEQINQHAMKQYKTSQGQNPTQANKLIGFIDAWSDFKGQNLNELKKQIVTTNQEKKTFSFFEYLNSFCGVVTPNLSSAELLHERDQIFAIAKMQFNDNEPLHFQMLYSIFCSLTNNQNCPRIGSHWEQIGFQGKNPSTDLRGAGMLGLLQILSFVSHYKEFISDVLQYSHDPIHHFPLSVTLINVTDIVLQACREQKLNSLINKEKSVISVFNNFYFATFYFLFSQYKSKQYTINRFDELRKSIEATVKQNPKKTLEDFKFAIQQYYKHRE